MCLRSWRQALYGLSYKYVVLSKIYCNKFVNIFSGEVHGVCPFPSQKYSHESGNVTQHVVFSVVVLSYLCSFCLMVFCIVLFCTV